MKPKKQSKFEEWFVKQHGERPKWGIYTDSDLFGVEKLGDNARCIREEQRVYDARRESALYAWQAAQRVFGKKGGV